MRTRAGRSEMRLEAIATEADDASASRARAVVFNIGDSSRDWQLQPVGHCNTAESRGVPTRVAADPAGGAAVIAGFGGMPRMLRRSVRAMRRRRRRGQVGVGGGVEEA